MTTQRDIITQEMQQLSKDKRIVFLGQGLLDKDPIYGTLNGVSKKKLLEMPVAENLIVGTAIGLALRGFRPVVIFQRMDFMTVACDQIINHLALMPRMSGGRIKLPVIIRAIIGSQSDVFDVGLQHKKNLTHIFEDYIKTIKYIPKAYTYALKELNEPVLIVEKKDDYKRPISPRLA